MAYKYKHAAVGGTFDLLHKGHETLLLAAFKAGEKVTIGVTSDSMNKRVDKITFQSESERLQNVRKFISDNKFTKQAKIVTITDIYGPTIKDKTFDVLVTSKERLKNAGEINKERKAKKLKKLPLIVTPIILAADKKPISSTRIKAGEINRGGKVYKNLLAKVLNKRLSETTRQKLKKPFGKITKSLTKSEGPTIAVGDATVASLLKTKILPKLSVIDFKVQRKIVYQSLNQLGFIHPNPDVIVNNEAGQISASLSQEIENALKSKNNGQVILVNGEDDLAVIPVVLLARLGTTVYYGQPNVGLVKVYVDEVAKENLCTLLNLA
ncbi:MAG: pantetheine-phosphate adenylyltransferase [Candidatus Curtissbacteria bacterium]|nr:pantetheine-phosphate adenylyltransferase [Candidatus Curtissbacteria bacterium]